MGGGLVGVHVCGGLGMGRNTITGKGCMITSSGTEGLREAVSIS